MLRTLEPQNGAKKMNAEAQSRYPCSYKMKRVYTQITDKKGGEVETLIALITFVWNFRSFLFHAGGKTQYYTGLLSEFWRQRRASRLDDEVKCLLFSFNR